MYVGIYIHMHIYINIKILKANCTYDVTCDWL